MSSDWIYALVDPRDGAVRYVGRSSQPARRLIEHLAEPSPALRDWIGELADLGERPLLQLLGRGGLAEERRAVREGLGRGWPLLNDRLAG